MAKIPFMSKRAVSPTDTAVEQNERVSKLTEIEKNEDAQRRIDSIDTESGQFADRAKIEKRLKLKLDLRFSVLIILYILNYIDRNNVSAARTYGFERDLGLQGNQIDTILSILYVSYMLMQVPSNIIVQKTGKPSLYLPACTMAWGAISIMMILAKDFTGAVLVRFFLGFVEAAFFPGALFLLSSWYTKTELGVRNTFLYCGSLISNAFGPMMAAGILGNMDGKLGRPAWEWLFVIEGSLTCFFAIVAAFQLPDLPHNTKRGFTVEERAVAELRMLEDKGGKSVDDDESTTASLMAVLKDTKAWVMTLSLIAMVVGLSFNQFFPQITTTLGYSRTISLLLCAPPFAFATIVAFIVSRHSDKTQERYWHIVGPLCFGIIGFIIAMTAKAFAARYVAMFLMASSYAAFTVFYAWISATFPRPAMRRAIAIALINCLSQLGNIAGSYTYPKVWGPSYIKSFGIALACFVACIIGITYHRWTLARDNKELDAQDGRGDANILRGVHYPKGFRYVL
ncbi:hypothetical protein OIO90_004995 [Microbotryomycetes sp. JL221]|nr:hypothetical protein OIO90_004995 [Microbotryomycetes sp. JL221]